MSTTRLANADPATDWSRFRWPDFVALPARDRTVVILPVHGFADHGLGQPLDVEEIVGSELLRRASLQTAGALSLRILPPLRWTLAPYPSCAFGIDPETAHDLLREIASSVLAAGFARLVFFNTSPWAEGLVDAASRDTRVALGLQTFVINLSGLGLDLHPASTSRARVQAIAAHLLGVAPEPAPAGDVSDADFRPGHFRQPPPVTPDAALDGPALLATASDHLARLLAEVAARGALGTKQHRAPVALPPAPVAPPAAALWPSPSYRPRYLPALSRTALAALPAKERALVIIPTGAIEQHGRHLPVGVDALLGQAWLERALPLLPADAPVFVTPPITYGKSNEHIGFPGTVWIRAKTLRRLLLALATELRALGFRQLAVFNTHGGNSAVLVTTLREIQTTLGLRAGMLSHGFTPPLSSQEREYGFHAGQWETALMLAAAPDTVQMADATCEFPASLDDPGELRPENAPVVFSWITSDISISGVMGDATLATAADGQTWITAGSASLAARIRPLLGP